MRSSPRTREGPVVVENLRLALQTVGAFSPSSPASGRPRLLEVSQGPLSVTCALYAASLLHLHPPANDIFAVSLSSLSSLLARHTIRASVYYYTMTLERHSVWRKEMQLLCIRSFPLYSTVYTEFTSRSDKSAPRLNVISMRNLFGSSKAT